ncbi:ATP-binding protein [Streptomyces acidicola]|uniref:ATP-binding protein n=1 Tax=Streptomyces acidicola TaxID=2596892 RepID=UPI0037FE5A5E
MRSGHSAPAARRFVRDTARSWGISSRMADDLETIAGELVANALERSDSGTITVTCAHTAGTVTISVIDEGHGPVPVAALGTPPDPEQEHGRGLLITDALADRWGTRETGSGQVVWAEIVTG